MGHLTQQSTREYVAGLLLHAALLVPLVVGMSFSIFPFIFPKVIYFEAVVGLLAALFIPFIIANKKYDVRNVYVYVLGAYAAVLGLSGMLAFDSSRAFWSNFERMTGIVFIWYAILFSILVTAYFSANPQKLQKFLSYLVIVSGVVATAGILQRIIPNFLMHAGDRVAGTFGNPIYLGGFTAQLLLIAAYLAYVHRKKAIVWWYVAAALLNVTALYLSGTRSALVGLAGALVVIGIYVARRLWQLGKKELVIGLAVGIFAAVSFLFALPRIVPSLENSMLARVTNVGAALDSTGSTRLIAWKIAITGFLERPVLGWGPENFFFVFNKFYNPKSLTFGSYETWFDHAHNAVFDVLVTQGAVGFALYLLQYGVIFWMCLKTRSTDENQNLLSAVLFGIFVLHFLHNIFVFDHPGSYAEFYALGGIVAARFVALRRSQSGVTFSSETIRPSDTITYVAAVFFIVISAYVVIPSYRQNNLDLKAQISAGTDLNVSQDYFKKAAAINGPHLTDVLLDTARIAQKIPLVVNQSQSFMTVPMFKNYYYFSIGSLDRLLQTEEPANVLAAFMKGQLYVNMFQAGDPSAYKLAEDAFAYATKLSPDRQQIAYSWAHLKLYKNDVAGALQLLEAANAKEPEIAIGHWYLALIYIDTDVARAAAEMGLAEKYGHDLALRGNRLLAGLVYSRAGNFEKSANLFAPAVADFYAPEWNPEFAIAADIAFEKTNRRELQQKIRAAFPNAFAKKK